MRVGRKIDIVLTIQSFKRYPRFVLFQAKTDVECLKKSCSLTPDEYDRYGDAFYVVSKTEEFELLLLAKTQVSFIPFPKFNIYLKMGNMKRIIEKGQYR